ncbi:MAG: N-formylglutamate deformylase [Halioglobus sp.]|nr:N-formylglutamate deformylase [Halioglobus sp.]
MSNTAFTFHAGTTPLLLSIPHDGRELPDDIAERMTPYAKALPDTDWHVARLYAFATDIGASVITARQSRYVIDLNRPASDGPLYDGQVSTGLCPARTFSGEPVYIDAATVDAGEQSGRTERYWQPYHEQIEKTLLKLKAAHGHALLWDAHSIMSEVPALFAGKLPVLNLGTFDGRSCSAHIQSALDAVAASSPYSSVCNGRFKGGYITRHYGRPDHGIHAVQLELAQRSYMNEKTLRYDASRSAQLVRTLRELLLTFIQSAKPARVQT